MILFQCELKECTADEISEQLWCPFFSSSFFFYSDRGGDFRPFLISAPLKIMRIISINLFILINVSF